MPTTYHLHQTPERSTLTLYLGEGSALVADDTHPNFDALVKGAKGEATATELRDLHDASIAVAQRFQPLSNRVSVANGAVYFDGDRVDDSITRQIVRCLDEGTNDWQPLVAFMENVAANPNDHSRTQLFDWLRHEDGISLDAEGRIVAYKGVEKIAPGEYQSVNSGSAVVNGEPRHGKIAQRDGDVVTMPRTAVEHDPSNACSYGLHVGTFDYASGWARGALLHVRVNPADVVSVPSDGGGAKIRVCRYEVIGVADQPESAPIIGQDEADYGLTPDDQPICDFCGEQQDEDGDCDNVDCEAYWAA